MLTFGVASPTIHNFLSSDCSAIVFASLPPIYNVLPLHVLSVETWEKLCHSKL